MPISLVSHYGPKPGGLSNLILKINRILSDHFYEDFTPYQLDQIHATIIGMETKLIEGQLFSRWCLEHGDQVGPISTSLLQDFIQQTKSAFLVKIGGYKAEFDYGFKSRHKIPFERSFSIQGDRAVINGWPIIRDGAWVHHSDALINFRNKFRPFNLCHKWNIDGYQDNDFFMVLGKINQKTIDPERIKYTSEQIRVLLSTEEIFLEIDHKSRSVVQYENPELPIETTKVLDPLQVTWNQMLGL